MAKKKKRSGGGGCGGGGGGDAGGGQGQPPKPAEECEEKAAGTDDDEKKAAEEKENKEEKTKQQGNKKAALPVVTAVLKVEMHCDGCAKRIRASVRHYPGVEGVAMEVDKGSMTVVGRLDAKKLRDRVAKKTKKKVELVVNPQQQNKQAGNDADGDKKQKHGNFKVHEYGKPDHMYDLYWLDKAYSGAKPPVDIKALHDYHAAKKDNHQDNNSKPCGGRGGKANNKEENKASSSSSSSSGNKAKEDNKQQQGEGKDKEDKACGKENKQGAKKPTVPVVATVVLKVVGAMGLHCDGCMNRVRCKLFKIKGVEQVSMDLGKNQVTVTGTMDTKALPRTLQKKLRRPVDVVTSKDKDKQDGGCKDKENKENKENKQKEKKQQQDAGGCKQDKDATTKALAAEMLMWKTAFYDQHSLLNIEFMLSDENPNACTVM